MEQETISNKYHPQFHIDLLSPALIGLRFVIVIVVIVIVIVVIVIVIVVIEIILSHTFCLISHLILKLDF